MILTFGGSGSFSLGIALKVLTAIVLMHVIFQRIQMIFGALKLRMPACNVLKVEKRVCLDLENFEGSEDIHRNGVCPLIC